ncbi:hypothetical protein BGZ98_004357 [Dissophora globulifera]|nr:hypothetical protein BGZ98_004357 [Dissophora globulifera]
MDQGIEAQAKAFIAFLEQCAQQPLSSATSSITACLDDLHAFLDRIQPVLRPAGAARNINSHHQHFGATNGGAVQHDAAALLDASELYPSLGLLLTYLCRNPVILSSAATANLVAQSVFHYSQQPTGFRERGQSSDKDGSAETWIVNHHEDDDDDQPISSVEKRMWCAARMRDMFRVRQQQNAASGIGARVAVFKDIFRVSDQDLQRQKMAQTTKVLSETLISLQEALQGSLNANTLARLTQWNVQLSGLCAPLVSRLAGVEHIVEGILDLTCKIKTRAADCRVNLGQSLLLDPNFVEQIMAFLPLANQLNKSFSNQTLHQLFTISPQARQQSLMVVLDRIMKASREHPGFSITQSDVLETVALAPLFSSSAENGADAQGLIQPILEDLAELAGEIQDWRFVRLCVLITEWVLTRPQGDSDSMDTAEDRETAVEDEETADDLFEELVSIARSVMKRDAFALTADIDRLLATQRDYVLCSGGPGHLVRRRTLAFLVQSAVSQHGGFLVRQIRHRLEEPYAAREQSGNSNSDNHSHNHNDSSESINEPSPLLGSFPDLFMARLILPSGSEELQEDSLCYRISALLEELHELCSIGTSDQEGTKTLAATRTALLERLDKILKRYRATLQLNVPLAADLVCAVGMVMAKKASDGDNDDDNDSDTAQLWWTALIQSAQTGVGGPPSALFCGPLVVRLRDLAETLPLAT